MRLFENEVVRCRTCLMDSTAQNFELSETGSCNFCDEFFQNYGSRLAQKDATSDLKLTKFLEQVKRRGQNQEYDCVIGLSGGADSCFALVKAVELGLRPLVVHMDNGWNSELAQNNIQNLVEKLNVDMVTHVIDWDEYRSMMEAFFVANVIDIELLYDNFMFSANYRTANKFGLKYIITGSNFQTEGIRMPDGWNWYKFDSLNIKSICKHSGVKNISSIQPVSTMDVAYFSIIKNIKWVPFLDYFDYEKENAISMLERDFSFKRYPYKHYESIFTRFYQGYLLPKKFGVDKRKLHLSNLVLTKQISRDTALKNIQESPYPSAEELENDKNYFLKKMGWTPKQLEDYLTDVVAQHDDFPNEKKWAHMARRLAPNTIVRKIKGA